jgi:hypothetical protein
VSTFLDFYAHAGPQSLAAIWSLDQPGYPQYTSWISDGRGNVTWRGMGGDVHDTECWRVVDDRILCTGFGPGWSTEPAWSGVMVRAEVVDMVSGAVFALPAGPGIVHYYAPALMTAGPIRTRNWCRIDGTLPMYFENEIHPGEKATNPCWHGGATTLDVIRERAVWWDANGGWVWGEGTAPFDAAGKPQVPSLRIRHEVTLAKGIGVWTLTDELAKVRAGCYSAWAWRGAKAAQIGPPSPSALALAAPAPLRRKP